MIHPVTRRDMISLALILIIAAALRFNDLGISEFAYDEATLSSSAQHIASGQSLPMLGMMSSASVPNFATGDYLMAIPFALSSSPMFAIDFIALLNVVGIGLLWLLAHRYLAPRIAVIAGLVYAVSPWALLYSRKIWAPDFVGPCVIMGLLLGLYGFVEGKRWAQLLSIPLFILALQLNFAAWALLPVMAWLIWIGRKRIFWPALIVGAILAALTVVPFIVGILQAQTLQHLQSSGSSLFQADRSLPFLHTFWLITGQGLETWHSLPAQADLIGQFPFLSILWAILLGLLLIGAASLWRRARSFAVLIVLWAFLPTAALLFSKESQAHYYASSIPAYCLLIGAGVTALVDLPCVTRGLRALVLGALGLILLTQVANWRSFLSFVDSTATPDFHTPIHDFLDIAAHLKPDVLLFPASSDEGSYAIWSPLLYRKATCVREATIAEGGISVLPQGEFSALRAISAGSTDDSLPYPNDDSETFSLRSGEDRYVLEQVDQPAEWTGTPLTSIAPARFDNGVSLNGYALADQRLYLDWTVPAASPNDYQYFAHLLNAGGNKVVQHDASFWSGKYWCNDRVITWVDLERPAEAVTLRVGMYRLENGQIMGDSVVDASGGLSPWIDILLGTE